MLAEKLNVAEIRPRLRNDVIFLRVETGIYLRSSEVSCVLKGRGAYEWMSVLGPRMTGEWTISDLCDGLDDGRRGTVVGLLHTLLEKGFARDAARGNSALAEPVLARFAPQINFVEHFMHADARSPHELFARFRGSRVLVAGPPSGIADAAVRGLLRNGLAEVSVVGSSGGFETDLAELAAAGTAAEVVALPDTPADLDGYDVIICAVDAAHSATLLDLTHRIVDSSGGAGPRLLPVVTTADQAVIGPVCGPATQPCWVCARLRLSANADPARAADFWRGLALGPVGARVGSGSMIAQRMIGNAIAFDLFRLRTGQLGLDDEIHAVVQDLTTLESVRERVLPHPGCPVPHREPTVKPPPVAKEESHGRAGLLVSPKLGLLSGWTDESIKQIPLKIGRVRLSAAGALVEGAREIAAFDLDVILDARASAVVSAVSTYVGRLGPVDGTAVAPEGLPTVASERIDTHSGTGVSETRSYLTATSLHDGSSWRVPAAAVYPFSTANAGLEFEPTSAGAAAAWSIEAVQERGLCSALAYRAAMAALRSSASLGSTAEAELAADEELAFLLESLRHLGLRARVWGLPGAAPAFAALAVVERDEPGVAPDWSIGSGLSARAAARAGLRDATGLAVTRHYEGKPADVGDPLLAELDPRVFPDTDGHTEWSLDRPAVTMAEMLTALDAAGSQALFAETTTIDCRSVGGPVAGTVVLASH